MTGSRFGNWLLQDELGRGAAGVVYRATAFEERPGEPKTAAVKVLDARFSRDTAFVERFPGEMLSLHRLTHPNIARFHDAGVQAGLVYYAQELADGTDLATRVKAEGPLDWTTCVFRVAVQAARALKHAHHRSILHRDLKPSNLILDTVGTLKVTDFGVAKFLVTPPLALPVEAMGSVCYAAPEHFTGKPLTRRSDLYALGGVLYTLVCGRPPFVAATAAEYMHRHCYMLPDRPINFVPKLPVEVDELICNLMMKDPARRYASAAALLEDLEHVRGKLERKGDRVYLPPDIVDPTGQHAPLDLNATSPALAANDDGRRRERIVRGITLLAGFLLVVGIIGYALFRPKPSAEELWTAAQPLVTSDNPDDWDKAREEFLDKLERWHPEAYQNEIKEIKRRISDRRELKRALNAGQQIQIGSEAERLYRRGLAHLQTGDPDAAREVWTKLIEEFRETASESRFVTLAETGIRILDKR
jgi:hypothetical protein